MRADDEQPGVHFMRIAHNGRGGIPILSVDKYQVARVQAYTLGGLAKGPLDDVEEIALLLGSFQLPPGETIVLRRCPGDVVKEVERPVLTDETPRVAEGFIGVRREVGGDDDRALHGDE